MDIRKLTEEMKELLNEGLEQKANKLIQTIDKKIATSEYRGQTVLGVKNLSRADLESIKMYAEMIRDKGNYNGFMEPRGGEREVLVKAGLIESLQEEIKELNADHPLMRLIEYVKQNGTDKGSEILIQFGDNTIAFDKQRLEDDRQACKAVYNGLEVRISLSAGSDCIWMEPSSYYMRPYIKAEEKDDIKTIIEKIFQCAQYAEGKEKAKEEQRKINANTKEIFDDLADKFECILDYWRDYELVYEGRDEDGCPDYGREYLDHDWQYLRKLNNYGVGLEDDLVIVLQSKDREQNSYEYPSGGTPDNITYTRGVTETAGICVFGDDYNKELNMKASEYIIKNYPDSKLAEYIKDEGIDKMDIEEFRDELIYKLDQMDLD